MSAINTPYGAVDAAVLHAAESTRYVVKVRHAEQPKIEAFRWASLVTLRADIFDSFPSDSNLSDMNSSATNSAGVEIIRIVVAKPL